ncbi:hypothetical protein P3342_009802 [Pyrenophora teres f. teres]|nr:hypothetical protein P3342_009802 [Pyrenophora teres f. teres]
MKNQLPACFVFETPFPSPNADCQIHSNRDRRNVCLVNKHCQGQMTPLLWKSISPDFQHVTPQSLAAFFNPNGNILKHVKEFTIYEDERVTVNHRLLQRFLLSLPENQLKSLSLSSNRGMTYDQLRIVLHRQRAIETLRVPVFESTHDFPLSGTPWVGEHIRKLQSLEINLRRESFDMDLTTYRYLVASAPDLKSLQIRTHAHLRLTTEHFHNIRVNNMTLSTPSTEILTKLEHLSLSFLDFAETKEFLPEIDFLKLNSLRLNHCTNLGYFFRMLLPRFKRGLSRLEILEIERTNFKDNLNPEEVLEESEIINEFLESFQGLKELYIVYHYALQFENGGAREAHAIRAHASTLEVLCAGSARVIHCFDNLSLTGILTECAKLKQLGLTLFTDWKLFNLHHNRNLDDLSGHSGLISTAGGAERLKIIAKHANIQTLRILDCIFTFQDGDLTTYPLAGRTPERMTRAASAWTKDWARNMIKYLKKRGSNIRVLAVYPHRICGPNYPKSRDLLVDADGQLFPRYTYDVKVDYDHYTDLIL